MHYRAIGAFNIKEYYLIFLVVRYTDTTISAVPMTIKKWLLFRSACNKPFLTCWYYGGRGSQKRSRRTFDCTITNHSNIIPLTFSHWSLWGSPSLITSLCASCLGNIILANIVLSSTTPHMLSSSRTTTYYYI